MENGTQNSRTKPGDVVGYERVAPPNSSGIRVLIVGAGFAGLSCAIECKRKGHEVIVLEKFREMKILGMSRRINLKILHSEV